MAQSSKQKKMKKPQNITDPKFCPHCKQWYAKTEFNKDKSKRDGLCSWCKNCRKKAAQERNKDEPPKERHGPRFETAHIIKYKVLYDPLDCCTSESRFTRTEIDDMLDLGFLAPGTIFKNGKHQYEITEDHTFERSRP